MKKINDIVKELDVIEVHGPAGIDVESVVFDSRQVTANSLFVAVRGTQSDGHTYIPTAITKGANAVVCEDLPQNITDGVLYIKVKDASLSLGKLASAFYGHPSPQLKLVGVTGTNGKTTIASLLYELFSELGFACGLLSTIENKISGEVIPSTHTTPDAVALNQLLAEMVQRGCSHCFIEVSSHAVDQNRIAGLHFAGGIFTNLTHDHLDYHKTFAAYLKAKQDFFSGLPATSFALTNDDDRNGKVMLQSSSARKFSYALKSPCDFKGKIIGNHLEGLHMKIDNQEVWFTLAGEFNAYNLLAIYGAACLLGAVPSDVLNVMSRLRPAEGRFEYVRSDEGVVGIVDYAHTPDALKNVLMTIRQTGQSDKRIITVAGAGGNRDKTKRPVMAEICSALSDTLILTSDNPRDEDPDEIIAQMAAGVPEEAQRRLLKITSRRDAIQTAVMLAKPGDVILIAGKGHEKYQEIKGVKHPFDDKQIVSELLLNRK